ncbi:MAG: Gfo/Idh/MocA family oxidoreductase [Proteobacteria bacterium]|nr:MAG: Gfo/Idh/MocA family oxidoreductase [Pseudomonadota bacterium]
MGIFSSAKKVRYAVVGLGDISQASMLPGIAHTGNSDLAALVSSDIEKAKAVGEKYGVTACYTYSQFPELLKSGDIDAIYLATPNWRHAEFVVPALEAGIHVLLEKPMEISSAKCREILAAQAKSSSLSSEGGPAKLMLAYRLHFEPGTLALIERLREGEIGNLRYFSSMFSQKVKPDNHRSKHGVLAGPLFDMGPYPINAARYVFEAEPTEVISATSVRHEDSQLGDLDDTVAVTLRFPEDRLATMVISYAAASINTFTVVGTEGSITMDPSFTFGEKMELYSKVGDKEDHQSFKPTDQFGGEMKYFSDCILENRDPEPNGEEGLADVRVIEAIIRAYETGKPQRLEPFERKMRIETDEQVQKLAKTKKPKEVDASSPTYN